MAEKEKIHEPKDLIEAIPEELLKMDKELELEKKMEKEEEENFDEKKNEILEEKKKTLSREEVRALDKAQEARNALASWIPKTELGKLVKSKKIKDIDIILSKHKKILEAEIVDSLIPIEFDLLLAGQAKGKFGGGKRRAWRQTQRKTMEGNVVTFSCLAVAGDRNGHVGIGLGKAKETLPAREKAIRKAKLNIIKILRGFESEEAPGAIPHTVPFKVEGKCSSVRIKLLPAPRGTGLAAGDECKKILRLAGIKDVYSVTRGQTRTTLNLAMATIDALNKTNLMK